MSKVLFITQLSFIYKPLFTQHSRSKVLKVHREKNREEERRKKKQKAKDKIKSHNAHSKNTNGGRLGTFKDQLYFMIQYQ